MGSKPRIKREVAGERKHSVFYSPYFGPIIKRSPRVDTTHLDRNVRRVIRDGRDETCPR